MLYFAAEENVFRRGMQSFLWGVSFPDFIDSVAPMVPFAKSPAWTAEEI
jgi:hypothetical protein